MATSDVQAFLDEKKNVEDDELAKQWSKLSLIYHKKLWHQLTLELLQFVHHKCFKAGGLLELYHRFLVDFESKISPLSLAELLLVVSKEIDEFDEAVQFIEHAKEKVKHSEEGVILCLVAIGSIRLRQSDVPQVKSIMEEASGLLDALSGVTVAHAPFYNLSIDFHKHQGNHNSYYRDALRYLGCVEVGEIPLTEQIERAYHLGLAGLLGDKIYNFGELLAHPILGALRDTDKQWLIDLLYAFNSGDLRQFQSLQSHWEAQPDLRENRECLILKVQLLALMEMTFQRSPNNRTLKFTEVADATAVNIAEVELLVMKALSLGLVKGSIDEVSQEVQMTWVQPRVLDRDQVSSLQARMSEWCGSVKGTVASVRGQAADLISSQTTL